MRIIILAAVLLALGASLLVGAPAQAAPGSGKTDPLAKVGRELEKKYTAHASGELAGGEGGVLEFDPAVMVDAVADGDPAALRAQLEALGLTGAAVFGRHISGRLPLAAVPQAAALSGLRSLQEAAAQLNVGSTTSQGDAAMLTDAARLALDVDGTGVLVGTLSDSYNCLGGAAGNVAGGDLPAGVLVVEEISSCSGATDEGRAMMQLIHDVAPGSSQAFHTAFNGPAGFAQGIIDLKDAGADVIVDDVIYFAEPMFQDGIIAQAVDTAEAAGVAYFSSAGNQARRAYESAYRDGTVFADGAFSSAGGAPHFFGGTAHDFDSGAGVDVFQSITVPQGATFTLVLQWDQPFFSVSGAPGSASDLDIYLFNSSMTQVLDGSVGNNVVAFSGSGDPVEVFSYTNPSGSGVTGFNLMIVKFDGAGGSDPGLMKYVLFRFGGSVNEYATNSGTLYGHTNAAGAMSIGAAYYKQTPAFGVDPAVIQSYSSAGPTQILYDTGGNPISELRKNPDVVAPDGANTTFFGTDTDSPADGFPNFFGTSAAAPHAAALAALMLEYSPSLTPASLYSVMRAAALDMDDPLTGGFDTGFDYRTGYGFLTAAALNGLVPTPTPTLTPEATPTDLPSFTGDSFGWPGAAALAAGFAALFWARARPGRPMRRFRK